MISCLTFMIIAHKLESSLFMFRQKNKSLLRKRQKCTHGLPLTVSSFNPITGKDLDFEKEVLDNKHIICYTLDSS